MTRNQPDHQLEQEIRDYYAHHEAVASPFDSLWEGATADAKSTAGSHTSTRTSSGTSKWQAGAIAASVLVVALLVNWQLELKEPHSQFVNDSVDPQLLEQITKQTYWVAPSDRFLAQQKLSVGNLPNLNWPEVSSSEDLL